MNVLVDHWRRFWFTEEAAYPLGLVRIAFGALTVAWTVSLLPDLDRMFGSGGIAPVQIVERYQWGLFGLWSSEQALVISWAALLVAAAALAAGWHSRLAAVLVFMLVISFQHRNPFVFNSGDALIRVEALFLAISPCGAALSCDRLRSAGRFWSAEVRPDWPIRLMQVQVSLIYLSTVFYKLRGDSWPEGTAVSYALRLEDMVIFPVPQWISTNPMLMNIATWGTLATELAIGILVWNRRCRPWVLAAGVALHGLIMISIGVGFFSLAMFVLYLAFLSPDVARRPWARWRREATGDVEPDVRLRDEAAP